jgi:hypothetical protein
VAVTGAVLAVIAALVRSSPHSSTRNRY